jgi:hypothetical protein
LTDCPEERATRHYLGPCYGFGPVKNTEEVIFAVFDDTKRDGARLSEKSFTNSNMVSKTQSLARSAYVSRREFDQSIVKARRICGVARASVSQIRELRAEYKVSGETIKKRAVCVIDLVELGDCAGHATMGYEPIEGVGQEQRGKKRIEIRKELAKRFSSIERLEEGIWANSLDVSVGRAIWLTNVLWSERPFCKHFDNHLINPAVPPDC